MRASIPASRFRQPTCTVEVDGGFRRISTGRQGLGAGGARLNGSGSSKTTGQLTGFSLRPDWVSQGGKTCAVWQA